MLTTKYSEAVLLDPLLNKGTGFLMEERERLGIRGMVPPRFPPNQESALQQGVNRVMNRYWTIEKAIDRYSYLIALQDRNEVLFYRCLLDNIDKLAPIIYTPVRALTSPRPHGAHILSGRVHTLISSTAPGVRANADCCIVSNWPGVVCLWMCADRRRGLPELLGPLPPPTR